MRHCTGGGLFQDGVGVSSAHTPAQALLSCLLASPKGHVKPPTDLRGPQPQPDAHLRVELLLRACVAVLAGISVLTLARVSPLIPMFYVRTRR